MRLTTQQQSERGRGSGCGDGGAFVAPVLVPCYRDPAEATAWTRDAPWSPAVPDSSAPISASGCSPRASMSSCMDNLITGSTGEHRAPRRQHAASPSSTTTSPTTSTCRAGSTTSSTSPRRRQPDRLPATCPIQTLKVGSLGRTRRSGWPRPGRALPARLHLRGLRRPAHPPAARGLLGKRQPGRAARGVRRGQALRRGADDGLPPPPRRRHPDRPDLQHLRPADAAQRRPRGARLHLPGAARASRSPSSATARRPARFCFVDDLIEGIWRLLAQRLRRSGEHRQPGRDDDAGVRRGRSSG